MEQNECLIHTNTERKRVPKHNVPRMPPATPPPKADRPLVKRAVPQSAIAPAILVPSAVPDTAWMKHWNRPTCQYPDRQIFWKCAWERSGAFATSRCAMWSSRRRRRQSCPSQRGPPARARSVLPPAATFLSATERRVEPPAARLMLLLEDTTRWDTAEPMERRVQKSSERGQTRVPPEVTLPPATMGASKRTQSRADAPWYSWSSQNWMHSLLLHGSHHSKGHLPLANERHSSWLQITECADFYGERSIQCYTASTPITQLYHQEGDFLFLENDTFSCCFGTSTTCDEVWTAQRTEITDPTRQPKRETVRTDAQRRRSNCTTSP